MTDFLQEPVLRRFVRILCEMYAHGWDERNGGNVSLRLLPEELETPLPEAPLRTLETGFALPELEGQLFLVTGTGKYFRNAASDPANTVGLVRLADGGRQAELLWGLTDGGGLTSEFPAHMMSHAVRQRVDPSNRVVMHCHPTNLLAMSFVHPLDERLFTRSLWQMCSECVIVFPDGISVLPWMVCGTREIGEATAEKMRRSRLIVWAQHGIYGAGRDLDEAFGLIETAEKAAEVWLKIAQRPWLQTIPDEGLRALARQYGVQPREEFL